MEALLRQRREELKTAFGDAIPHGLTLEHLELPSDLIARIARAGNVVAHYMQAVITLCTEERYEALRRTVPSLVRLVRPEAVATNAIGPHAVPPMFRLDLIVTPDLQIKASEFEMYFGSYGFVEVFRRVLFPEDTSISIADTFAKCLGYLSGGALPRCVVIVCPETEAHQGDFVTFVELMRSKHPMYEVVEASTLRLDTNNNLVTADNPEPIRFVHRHFELFMVPQKRVPNFDLIQRACEHGTTRVIPGLAQFVEEKLVMALLDEPDLADYFAEALSRSDLEEIRALAPRTRLVSEESDVLFNQKPMPMFRSRAQRLLQQELEETTPAGSSVPARRAHQLRYVSESSRIVDDKRAALAAAIEDKGLDAKQLSELAASLDALVCLATIPTAERRFVMKLSGYEPAACESKSVIFLNDFETPAVHEELQKALSSEKVYVIQEMVPHHGFDAKGLVPSYSGSPHLEPDSLAMVEYPRAFGRVEPYYFLTSDNSWELGELQATLSPVKKTHLTTKAIVTALRFPR